MPRTYTHVAGPSRRHQYTEESLEEARAAVGNGMSQREAARQYGVPRSTLGDSCARRHVLSTGGQTIFTDAEETIIAQNIATVSEWGYPLTTLDVRMVVRDYLHRRGRSCPGFKDNLPGKEWVRLFLKRRRNILTNRLCQNISNRRASLSADLINQYFDNLAKEITLVPPTHIINYDETNLTDDPGQKKCIFRRGTKYPERIMNPTKSSTSVMFACSADETLLRPYVVYKAEHLHDRWIEGGPRDATCFQDWFMSVIIPYCRRLTGTKLIIGDNLSSHFSEEVITTCATMKISFVCLPPNSTYLCQPLDVSVYGPMKKYWRQVLTE